MTDALTLLSPVPDKFLLGYMVLNATKAPVLPFVAASAETHPPAEGGINGSVVCLATESQPFYYPQRGRAYTFNSVQNYGEDAPVADLMSNFANIHDKNEIEGSFHTSLDHQLYPRIKENSLITIEQHKPFGLISIISKGVDLYMFGLHNEFQSLLVWTNLATYEDLLQRNYGDDFWLYRFKMRRDLTTVIFSRRVCSRWYRWSQQANFKSAASRFPALEKSLFRLNQAEENV